MSKNTFEIGEEVELAKMPFWMIQCAPEKAIVVGTKGKHIYVIPEGTTDPTEAIAVHHEHYIRRYDGVYTTIGVDYTHGNFQRHSNVSDVRVLTGGRLGFNSFMNLWYSSRGDSYTSHYQTLGRVVETVTSDNVKRNKCIKNKIEHR